VAIWYPTRAFQGRTAARYAGLIVRPEAKAEAPIESQGRFPVLLFSHGNAALAEQSFYLTEYFAQHGWVVISPDHTENTFKDTDGAVNYSSAMDRPQDISAVLDWAQSVPKEHFLHERLTDDIALAGHSFGGYTTLAVVGGSFPVDDIQAHCNANPNDKTCQAFSGPESVAVYEQGFLDTRIKAAIPQTPAGAFFFGDGLSNITIPTMLMTGALDTSLRNENEGDPIWASLGTNNAQNIRLDFITGGHFTFSNMCTLFGFIDLVKDDGCGDGFISPDVALDIIRQYTLAFAQKHLLGDTRHDALLSGESQPWSQHLTFEKK
jgi:predicted dienelactone hydrolase